MLMPRIAAAFRGGDDHLLSGIGGCSSRKASACSARMRWRRKSWCRKARSAACSRPSATAPISRLGLDYLRATGPFDVGQAVVVAGKHVLAVEAAEGTDQMLARVARDARQRPRARAGRQRRAGEGAQARPGPALRSALDRPADRRRRRARRACRHRGRGRRDHHRRAGTAGAAADRANIFVVGAPAEMAVSDAQARMSFWSPARNSGDRLGAALIAAIRRRHPGARFSGVGGAHMAAKACQACFRSAIWRSSALPRSRRACRKSCAAFARPPTPSSPPSPMCWSSSTARNSPIAWRGACARARRRSRSSIMFARRCGPGGRAARARCALTSIMCWRCCRSSRRRCGSWAGRRAPLSAIR